MKHGYLLSEFVDRTFAHWEPEWCVPQYVGDQTLLNSLLGDALVQFLVRQLDSEVAEGLPEPGALEHDNFPRILLTKTPSVDGLQHFRQLFPDAALIIIVRDGRAIVESGIRSFDWNFEDATRSWTRAADGIIDFLAGQPDSEKTCLLVKYEELLEDHNQALGRIFKFLDLDPAAYDYHASTRLAVVGSSESRKQGSKIHWKEERYSNEFNPLQRFYGWEESKHSRFNWLAGQHLSNLGYDSMPAKRGALVNSLLDLKWQLTQVIMQRTARIRRKYRESQSDNIR